MKKFRKLIAVVMAALIVVSLSSIALAVSGSYGSAAVKEDGSYTLEEMLTYAIEDEYAAQAEYKKIIANYGDVRPFTNIVKAEATHIAELTPLFEKYGVAPPENRGEEYASLPESTLAANKTGVAAEIANISMYEKFLSQDIPDDVRDVFTALRDASKKHLTSFERGVTRLESGTSRGVGYGRGR